MPRFEWRTRAHVQPARFVQHCCACLLPWTLLGVVFPSRRLILPLTLAEDWRLAEPTAEELALHEEHGVPLVAPIKGQLKQALELLALTLQNALLDNQEALGPYWHKLSRFVR